MQRLLCTRCGDSIHPDTASRNDGLCIPCVRGNTLTIEQRNQLHRNQRDEERARLESPRHKYWISLVNRAYATSDGFESLSHGDRLYYLVNMLTGEVHNGGFDQYFSNSSGDRHAETVAALFELGDRVALPLLREAKTILFGSGVVPVDSVVRFKAMATSSAEHPQYKSVCRDLDAVDQRFYASATDIDALLEHIARRYKLYSDA
jgi:hypothetical protein